jgi:hypothetical protein
MASNYSYTSPTYGGGFAVSSKRARDGGLRHAFTYAEAATLLAHARNGERLLQNNTRLHAVGWLSEPSIAVRLHHTDVVVYHANGDISLSSGGWRTLTTADRIRTYVLYGRLGSDRGEWFFFPRGGGARSVFFDNMRINQAGEVVNWDKYPWARARQDIEEMKQAAREARAQRRAAARVAR